MKREVSKSWIVNINKGLFRYEIINIFLSFCVLEILYKIQIPNVFYNEHKIYLIPIFWIIISIINLISSIKNRANRLKFESEHSGVLVPRVIDRGSFQQRIEAYNPKTGQTFINDEIPKYDQWRKKTNFNLQALTITAFEISLVSLLTAIFSLFVINYINFYFLLSLPILLLIVIFVYLFRKTSEKLSKKEYDARSYSIIAYQTSIVIFLILLIYYFLIERGNINDIIFTKYSFNENTLNDIFVKYVLNIIIFITYKIIRKFHYQYIIVSEGNL